LFGLIQGQMAERNHLLDAGWRTVFVHLLQQGERFGIPSGLEQHECLALQCCGIVAFEGQRLLIVFKGRVIIAEQEPRSAAIRQTHAESRRYFVVFEDEYGFIEQVSGLCKPFLHTSRESPFQRRIGREFCLQLKEDAHSLPLKRHGASPLVAARLREGLSSVLERAVLHAHFAESQQDVSSQYPWALGFNKPVDLGIPPLCVQHTNANG